MNFFKSSRTLIVVLLLMGTGQAACAQSNFYKLHALFLYNFSKHIQWNDVGSNFVIGVFGSDNALEVVRENLTGRKYGTKELQIIRINSATQANNCQMVYMPKSSKSKVLELIEATDPAGKLFVTEDDLIEEGASISFVIKDARLNFKISKSKVDQAGLKVSNALLSLGEIVD